MRCSLLTLGSMISAVLATARTSPPSGAITVGSSGTYSTIQDAVDSLSTSSTTAQSIFIYSGTYEEQVYIPTRKAILTIYGETEDTSSYSGNLVTITHSASLLTSSDDDETATLRNWAPGAQVYNINIKNTYGKGSQALALSAYGSKQGYYGVGLYGYQDTLLAETGYQYYANSYIEGAVDFIFGQSGYIWIENTDIAVTAGGGAITAAGPASSSVGFFVISNSNVAASSDSTATSGSAYLGRPWTEYAHVMFQSTVLSDVINSAGWEVWSTSTSNTEDVKFEEYDNSGAGASGTRASFATAATSALEIASILGSDYADWIDSDYLS